MADDPKTLAKRKRAEEFKARFRATGLTQEEFRTRAGITRNVFYNLSIGQEPKPDQKRRIEALFNDPARKVVD